MRKIPTLFQRDPETHRVVDLVTPGCEWVLAGIGYGTQKMDGACCMVRKGKIYKRREVERYESCPEGFELIETDSGMGKSYGWMPVGAGPEDKWFREAFGRMEANAQHSGVRLMVLGHLGDRTYELCGPKINGNPERMEDHQLVVHGHKVVECDPGFESLRKFFGENNMEGIVWHDGPGRAMAKIKAKDFGIKRGE